MGAFWGPEQHTPALHQLCFTHAFLAGKQRWGGACLYQPLALRSRPTEMCSLRLQAHHLWRTWAEHRLYTLSTLLLPAGVMMEMGKYDPFVGAGCETEVALRICKTINHEEIPCCKPRGGGHDQLSFGHVRSLPSLARDSRHILNLFIVH